MKKKIVFLVYILLLGGATFFLPAYYRANKINDGVAIKKYKAASGKHYTFFLPGKLQLQFTLQRPDTKDSSVALCIAGAFTVLDHPDGINGVNGKVFNSDSINRRLGGAIIIIGDSVNIMSTDKGRIFTSGFIDSLRQRNASFFQQIQMVVNGKAEDSKSERKFRCRGVVKFKSGGFAVVESQEEITLKTFAADMEKEGSIKELLYTDMGAWDEGWYKNEYGKVVSIGSEKSATDRQCNWLVYKRK